MKSSTNDSSKIPVPVGYREVPAGQVASFAQYRCSECNEVFVSGHYLLARVAMGNTIRCCGEPAWWIRNLEKL